MRENVKDVKKHVKIMLNDTEQYKKIAQKNAKMQTEM